MFLKNTWYAAALAHEVKAQPLARTIIGEPIILFRQENGTVCALEDRCCHRGLPLAHGEVIGNNIQCGYHGLTFNGLGQCVKIPGQEKIPRNAKVKTFPVVEQDQMVWIWMGDPDQAT